MLTSVRCSSLTHALTSVICSVLPQTPVNAEAVPAQARSDRGKLLLTSYVMNVHQTFEVLQQNLKFGGSRYDCSWHFWPPDWSSSCGIYSQHELGKRADYFEKSRNNRNLQSGKPNNLRSDKLFTTSPIVKES